MGFADAIVVALESGVDDSSGCDRFFHAGSALEKYRLLTDGQSVDPASMGWCPEIAQYYPSREDVEKIESKLRELAVAALDGGYPPSPEDVSVIGALVGSRTAENGEVFRSVLRKYLFGAERNEMEMLHQALTGLDALGEDIKWTGSRSIRDHGTLRSTAAGYLASLR